MLSKFIDLLVANYVRQNCYPEKVERLDWEWLPSDDAKFVTISVYYAQSQGQQRTLLSGIPALPEEGATVRVPNEEEYCALSVKQMLINGICESPPLS